VYSTSAVIRNLCKYTAFRSPVHNFVALGPPNIGEALLAQASAEKERPITAHDPYAGLKPDVAAQLGNRSSSSAELAAEWVQRQYRVAPRLAGLVAELVGLGGRGQ
jgi:hypothetical protein